MKKREPGRMKRHREDNSTASDAVGSCRTMQGLWVRARADVNSKSHNKGTGAGQRCDAILDN